MIKQVIYKQNKTIENLRKLKTNIKNENKNQINNFFVWRKINSNLPIEPFKLIVKLSVETIINFPMKSRKFSKQKQKSMFIFSLLTRL